MKEMIVKIPEESTEFVTELLEKLGVQVKESGKRKTVKKIKSTISPTYLFGKWKDLDISAETLRKNAWQRQNKF
ncbi:MAG: hypothetical protein JNM14_07545 [Ferruginibacter sp.]|nr:hypothetical protein [Ferruginibacter sp.]